MKTTFLSLLAIAASVALVVPLSAQNGPQDLGVEPSLIEHQMELELRTIQTLEERPDLTVIAGKADDDEEWDMVRRLEMERQDQSVDAMIQRMVLELQKEASRADRHARNPEEMKEHDEQRRMNLFPREDIETTDWQSPAWFIGLMVEPLEPFMREHLALESEAGVKVTRVLEGSPAAKLGIRLNDIIFEAGGKRVSSLEDLRAAVEKAGKEDKPLSLEWVQKGERKSSALHPNGPPRPEQIQRTDKPADPAMAGLNRRMMEVMKRLDHQQRQIEALRRQVGELRPQRMMRNRKPGNEASPNPRSR